MAKKYDETDTLKPVITGESKDNTQIARDRILNLIMERVENGSNIDYIVKLSEVYKNIK